MKRLILPRDYRTEEVTLGQLIDPNGTLKLQTIERPWLNNQSKLSCIPAGVVYVAVLDFYHKGGYPAYELQNVRGRTEIKIHIANFVRDLLGCIGLGMNRRLAPEPMVTNSRDAFAHFMEYMKDHERFELEIKDV